MKEIIQTYASVIIAVTVGIMLLMLFPQLSSAITGKLSESKEMTQNIRNVSYDNYRNEMLPKLKLRGDFFVSGQLLKMDDIFSVEAAEQNLSSAYIYEVYDSEGKNISSCIYSRGEGVVFPHGGIYKMLIKLLCVNGMEEYVLVDITVNQMAHA